MKKNSFSFKGTVSHPTVGILYPSSPSSKEPMTLGVFRIENSNISIFTKYYKRNSNGMKVKFLDIDSLKGSKSQELKRRFDLKMEKTFYKAKNHNKKKMILYNNLFEFIKTNPKSELSGNYLASLNNFYNYLSSSELKTIYKLMDTNYQVSKDLKNHKKYY